MIGTEIAGWIACHVLGHHDDVQVDVGVNRRAMCRRCKRLGRTFV